MTERLDASTQDSRMREGKEEARPTRLIVVMSGASMAYEIDPERRLDPEWKPGPYTNTSGFLGFGKDIEWKFPLVLPTAGPIEPGTERGTRRDVSGGWARMRALQRVFGEEQAQRGSAKILVTGGMEVDVTEKGRKIQESRADEAARVLIKRYELPKNSVESIGGPGSTLGNSAAASRYIQQHPEYGEIKEIEAVTNDYHMLRTWIMFSAGFLGIATGREPKDILKELPEEKKQAVLTILSKATQDLDRDDWTSEKIRATRTTVMDIMKDCFAESPIKVKPLVAEEVIEHSGAEEEMRYAERLRTHPRVRDMLKREYGGIKQLLDGTYGGKF